MSKLLNRDWADKRWLQQPIEQHETHWNHPHPNTLPRRFLFALLIMLAVFLMVFGSQIAHADTGNHTNHYADFDDNPCKYDEDIWWPGHLCTEPAYYGPHQQHFYVGPIPNNPGTVPEPGTPLLIGFGLIAMAYIKRKPRVFGMRWVDCSRIERIAAGDLEHRKTSSN